jgi:hypothetical protein
MPGPLFGPPGPPAHNARAALIAALVSVITSCVVTTIVRLTEPLGPGLALQAGLLVGGGLAVLVVVLVVVLNCRRPPT